MAAGAGRGMAAWARSRPAAGARGRPAAGARAGMAAGACGSTAAWAGGGTAACRGGGTAAGGGTARGRAAWRGGAGKPRPWRGLAAEVHAHSPADRSPWAERIKEARAWRQPAGGMAVRQCRASAGHAADRRRPEPTVRRGKLRRDHVSLRASRCARKRSPPMPPDDNSSTASGLRAKAARIRSHAWRFADDVAGGRLRELAEELEARADAMDSAHAPSRQSDVIATGCDKPGCDGNS